VSETAIARPALTPPTLGALMPVIAVPMLGIFSFVAAAALLPSDRTALMGYTIATATLIGTVVAVDRARPREHRNLLLSMFSFSYTVFFVIPVFVYYAGEVGYIHEVSPNPSPIPLTPADVALGALASLLGYTAMLAGYVLPVGRVASLLVPRMRREWSAEAALGVALVTIPLGWTVIFAGQLGLIPREVGNGILGVVASGTSFGIGLIAITYQRYRSRAALLLMALVIPPTMFFNFFTSSKMLFVMPLVMIAIVHVIVTRRLRIWWIAGFIVSMALFYPASQFYRDLLYNSGEHTQFLRMITRPQQVFALVGKFVTSIPLADYFWTGIDATFRRLDGISILTVIVRDTPGRVPYQGGWSLAQIPMAYIPRVLWPGKPVLGTGEFITNNYCYAGIETSTGATWLGNLYMEFGWLGILVGMTIVGIFLRYLQESFLGIDATIPAILAGVVSLLSISATLGGELLISVNSVVFALAPLMIAHVVVRTLTPRPARMPPPL
jgi:hypothetical protein